MVKLKSLMYSFVKYSLFKQFLGKCSFFTFVNELQRIPVSMVFLPRIRNCLNNFNFFTLFFQQHIQDLELLRLTWNNWFNSKITTIDSLYCLFFK